MYGGCNFTRLWVYFCIVALSVVAKSLFRYVYICCVYNLILWSSYFSLSRVVYRFVHIIFSGGVDTFTASFSVRSQPATIGVSFPSNLIITAV